MSIPQVAIVGRPNVGKSSLFNWLVGKRIAIVDPTAGVTRDRVTCLIQIRDRYVELVDTGGMGIRDSDNLTADVEHQIEAAIESASVVLFVVDTRTGIVPLDEDVSQRLRQVNVPVICVANKTDHENLNAHSDEFHRFGRNVIRVSAVQKRGREDLLDAIFEVLPPADAEEASAAEPVMKVAIVGRRNTGKSTFVNTLSQSERMIVSEVPGTTRDSVDVRFEMDGKVFLAIDTPGLRRRQSVTTDIDFYGMHRAHRSIRRADVVLLFFDAAEEISKVDRQLCDYVAEQYKPCIFVVNKWDLLVDRAKTGEWAQYLRDTFRTMQYVPIAFVTGMTGKNVKTLLNHAQMLYRQSLARVTTGQLNRLVATALDRNPPPMHHTHRPKVYFATQVATQPPTIVLFCNDPKAISADYQRYLLGVFRDELEFAEVPIKLYFRKRESTDSTDEIESKLKK